MSGEQIFSSIRYDGGASPSLARCVKTTLSDKDPKISRFYIIIIGPKC